MGIDDGGPYTPGSTYRLFLKRNGEGQYYVINSQARYAVKGGALEGVDPTDSVAAKFHGKSLDEVGSLVVRRARQLE